MKTDGTICEVVEADVITTLIFLLNNRRSKLLEIKALSSKQNGQERK